MTDPQPPDTPIYDAVAELLADCPPAGPIRPDDEPPLIEDVALPTLGDGEEGQRYGCPRRARAGRAGGVGLMAGLLFLGMLMLPLLVAFAPSPSARDAAWGLLGLVGFVALLAVGAAVGWWAAGLLFLVVAGCAAWLDVRRQEKLRASRVAASYLVVRVR